MMFPILFSCIFQKNTTYTQGFYFIVMCLCIIAWFSTKWFTPFMKEALHILAPTLSLKECFAVQMAT